MLEKLYETSLRLSDSVAGLPKRYLYDKINFGQRLVGICGARGVGKTTLILQYLKENFSDPRIGLYVSADHLHVAAAGLYSIADEHHRNGGQLLCIDEIHKHDNWAQELKNIYDSFPDLSLIVSGSSALHLVKHGYDLSRRLVRYSLKGLSFREFILFKIGVAIPSVSLPELLANHTKMSSSILEQVKVFPLFKEYLATGYYPFWLEGLEEYWTKLQNVLDKIIYEDIPSLFDIRHRGIQQIRRLLYILANSKPFTVNVSELARELEMSRDSLYQYLDYLSKSHVTNATSPASKGKAARRKPGKIYLENTSLLQLLATTLDQSFIGTRRETFFVSQFADLYSLYLSRQGDFADGDGRIYEVGGRGKSSKQVSGIEKGYIICDDTEIGSRRRIPLYLFGFLY